jgi:glyoxylase-like metal-dependent hydrolase (beta-lactamase superfamily II)
VDTISRNTWITAIEGNRQSLDGGAMFGNAPRAVWQRWHTPDEQGRIELACRAMLIETDNQKILCEAGIGSFFEPKLAERYGVKELSHKLRESLKGLKVKEDEIDVVILSHLHFDHVGGILPTFEEIAAGNDQLLFPNARYIVGREAFERAKHPHFRDRASFIPGLVEKLEKSGRLSIVDGRDIPGYMTNQLSFRFTNGHTPGQMHTVFRGSKASIIFAGDLIPGRSWVHLPITMGYDRFPEKLIEEKAELYQQAVPEQWYVFYTHDPDAAASLIKKKDDGKFEPTGTIEKMVRFAL